MNKRWEIAADDSSWAAALGEAAGVPRALARILWNRGFQTTETLERYLRPQLKQLGDPFELPDMPAAVARILEAIDARQRIVIYGDYDVDGVTASALLTRVLRAAGGMVENFLPLRMEEGYGLSTEGLARCVEQHRPELLIAVDCGTSSWKEIAQLQQQGIAVIVLDHHEPPETLPDCVLVNPKRAKDSPLQALASVGVAFKVAHALLKQRREWAERIDLREQLDLVAMGTVADIVPLTGENRIFVKAGLERLARTNKVGLRALMEVAKVSGELAPHHIGFRLGPRLNAAGRLADAMASLELLLTEDPLRAATLAKLLNDHNADRQRIEEKIVEEALALAREQSNETVLVVANEAWHSGVIGIVASRITQEFYRPAVVIGQEGKGSCRSIAGFSMVAALAHCADLLERYGGHEMAAGLSIQSARVVELRGRLNSYAAGAISEEGLRRRLRVDAVVGLEEIDEAFLNGLDSLEPFGAGNPTPVWAARKLWLRGEPRVVGKNHLKFQLTDGSRVAEAIGWSLGDFEFPNGALDVAFVPEWNEYGGRRTIQWNVRDMRAAETEE